MAVLGRGALIDIFGGKVSDFVLCIALVDRFFSTDMVFSISTNIYSLLNTLHLHKTDHGIV